MFEIGNTLREARLRRGFDIPQCEQETKIRAKYLRAMEEEQFDLMPSPTYVRGFLRTYADFLDLDGQLVLDEYESRFGGFDKGHDHDPRRGRGTRSGVPPGQYARDRGRGRGRGRRGRRAEPRRTEAQLLWLAIGGVMTVALLVWLGIGNEDAAQPSSTPPATQTTGTTGTGTGEIEEQPVTPAVERIDITLTGVGEQGSYLEVRGKNAQGPRVFVGTLGPGEVQTYSVKRSIYVLVGAPQGLTVAVDGATKPVSGGVGGYIVSKSGVRFVGG
ncbi:MAG: cytoskeleton protein RodZ [Miltoncostaeaceae bacterium]|jgi:hypothetical protein|nr:cytoskeleton protein RodZ [Miltoncostaeaceae bacterium]